jgi:hypothetical protein
MGKNIFKYFLSLLTIISLAGDEISIESALCAFRTGRIAMRNYTISGTLAKKGGDITREEDVISSVIKGFYRWYHDNYDAVNSFQLVPNAGNRRSLQYRVDFAAVKRYLDKLRSSGFLARQYLERERKYYERCDRIMLSKKQRDGPPDGLEHDRILLTQEIDYEMQEVLKARVRDIDIKGNRASASIYRYQIHLMRERGKWKILSID